MLEHTPSLRELSEKKCLPWRCSRVALIKYGAIRRNSTIPRCGFSTAFVAATKQHAPVRVPRAECTTMASPSAVVGRWPHGLLTKATRMLNKKAPTIIENTTLLVQPVHLATYIERHFPRVHSILAKIDTEGFEIQVLESMRPLWPLAHAVVLELQPNAWRFANVSVAQGLRTLSNLMSEHSLVAITLPHSKMGAEQKAQVVFDPCSYPLTSVKLNELVEPTTGIDAVRVYDTDGLLAFVKHMLRHPGSRGWFHEVLLMRKESRCSKE